MKISGSISGRGKKIEAQAEWRFSYKKNMYDHFKTENSPYKPLYYSLGSKRLEPDSKYSDLIETFSIQLPISRSLFFRSS